VPALDKAERILYSDNRIRYKRYADDFAAVALSNVWCDLAGTPDKIYVVQTNPKVIERCLLMTTDPGDLVLDPTCGSGTTAFVAEQWGRRWITVDTSRVALALAKQRLLTSRYPYFKLRELNAEDLSRNPKGTWLKNGGAQPKTFSCTALPHVRLKSIASNTSLDPIAGKYEPILAGRLKELNAALKKVTPEQSARLAEKLRRKQRDEGKKSITEAERRRWVLPGNSQSQIRKQEWQEWEVPFDTDPDWPKPLQDALKEYRKAWRAKMDEVNQCIAANAEIEELVDKPEELPGVVRVSGPFTVEGVISVEDGPDTPIGGAPEPLETFTPASDATAPASMAADVQNVEAHLDKVIRLLKASGVDFPATPETPARNMKFSRLEPITSANLIHAEGEWANGDHKQRRVAVTIGPDVGNLTAYQVEDVIRDANRKGYDDVVFAAFGFDAAAQDAIEGGSHPKVRLHMALIRPDVAMGDLLKTQPGSQLFTVFSAPRIKGPAKQSDGTFTIEVEGMDVYDPVSNTLYPTNKERIAAWWLDSDYDGRTFCICQAFFPDKTKWDKLARALGDRGIIEEDAFSALSGLESLPFPRPPRLKKGEKWRVAVKVIDPRGNEGMRVIDMP
jgi:adenine-specific DNA-methyltransferase